MKKKLTVLMAGMFGLYNASAQVAQLVNIGTGVVNVGTGFQSPTAADDTWDVKVPGSSTFVDAIVSNGDIASYSPTLGWLVGTSTWDDNGWAMWISSSVYPATHLHAGKAAPSPALWGDYEFQTQFTAYSGCAVSGATLYVDYIGADDLVEGMYVNGNYYDLTSMAIDFNPLVSAFTVPVSAAHINAGGANTISFVIHSNGVFIGFYMAADFEVKYSGLSPAPSITGTSPICSGQSTNLCCNYWPSSNITLDWSTGVHPAPQCINVSPTSNTTYSVTVTNQFGCSATANKNVTVNPNCLPNGMMLHEESDKYNVGSIKSDMINEAEESLVFNVYPNPGSGLFTIEMAGDAGKIQVFDLMGKNIRTIEMNGSSRYSLDLAGYARGIYTVNVITNGSNQSQKIVLE